MVCAQLRALPPAKEQRHVEKLDSSQPLRKGTVTAHGRGCEIVPLLGWVRVSVG